MPRNGSGTYTLPSGNPVVSGTIIESTWANSTLADLADSITNSLARNGEGGMTAALRLIDGVVATPSLAFASETGSGLYRAAAGDLGLSVLGSRILRLQAAGASIAGTLGVTGATNLATSSGNVGIGTASPTFKLEVAGNGSFGGDLDVAGAVFRKFASGTGYLIYGTNSVTNNGVYYDQANSAVSLWTVSTQRLTVDSSGNTGFATTSPVGRVDVVANGYSAFVARSASAGTNVDVIALKAVDSAAANFANVAYQAKSHVWGYNGSTLGMVLDASGNVGIGTSSPTTGLDVVGGLTVRGGLVRADATGATSSLQLVGGNALAGGSGAAIVVRGALVGTNSGGMEFYTGNTVSTTERMRLDSSGNFGIGTASPTRKLHVEGTVYAGSTVQTPLIGNSTGTALIIDASGFIRANTSSIRYKENIQPIDVGLDLVMQMEPVSYDLKNGSIPQVGFIAEDFPEPRLVNKSMIDPKDSTKGEQVESINYANLTAILVKAIQELKAEVDALKAVSTV